MNVPPDTPTAPPCPPSLKRGIAVSCFGLFVFATLIGLGSWQLYRWQYKLNISAQIAHGAHAPPVAAPGPQLWHAINAHNGPYRHVRLHGHYLRNKTTFVHGSSRLGYGYWVLTPLLTRRGFVVLVNRGYVPAGKEGHPRVRPPAPTGQVTLDGLLRLSEAHGAFLRPNHPDQNRWYSRDVGAIAQARELTAHPVAPYFVDADARTNTGHWPVGGLTPLHIYNHSLGYAITWYSLALLALLGIWIVARHDQQRRHQSTRIDQ